ncbi:phenazine antibiotic biosynthesis protein [Streptomyces sp. NPDC047028]|uniref:phenazine antibiotic biosynthesis protein n=1 Tax=Streptomyces sp. NPDC047028 TaxID=3155793 RepID=UPI0033CAA443
MPFTAEQILDLPFDVQPDPDEFIRAAMEWHFNPETGCKFWLDRAATLGFDPRADVKTYEDLRHFPNVATELRDVRGEDLVPRGYGNQSDVIGFFESGGTTGAPKRVVLMRDWLDRMVSWSNANLDRHGVPRGGNWLGVIPTGPHVVGTLFRQHAVTHGRHGFTIDLDPRWVKRLIADGQFGQVDAYAQHLIDQAADVLRTQDIGLLTITPPLLERLARDDKLVALVNKRVKCIRWGGTQMDADSRHLFKTEVFPEVALCGEYGSTMIIGVAGERAGLTVDDPCVFDSFSPYVTFTVVDPKSLEPVPYGERGQVLVNHVSKSFLLPSNLERDLATRFPQVNGAVGDSVADIGTVAVFEDENVIEGVY